MIDTNLAGVPEAIVRGTSSRLMQRDRSRDALPCRRRRRLPRRCIRGLEREGHIGLASYYTERGETPGWWVGSGMVGIDGLVAGDVVTAEQMQALFGSGHHPLAAQRLAALEAAHAGRPGGLSVKDQQAVTRLGAPFEVFAGDGRAGDPDLHTRVAIANKVQTLGPVRMGPRTVPSSMAGGGWRSTAGSCSRRSSPPRSRTTPR